MPQLSYSEAPAAGMAGGDVDTGLSEVISRVLTTQKLVEITVDATPADGAYTVTINGVEKASFTASTSTTQQVRDGLLSDLQAASGDFTAEGSSTNKILVENTSEDADMTVAVAGGSSDITAATLVAQGQEVPFGIGVVTDPRAASQAEQCRLPRLTGEITAGTFLGVARCDTAREANAGGYKDGDAISIKHRGRIWVNTEGTVNEGGAVYCRYASGSGGSQLGAFRADADTTTAALVPNAKFCKGRTGAGLAQIELL